MLTPCCHCQRHVRSGDARCPFCGAPAPTPVPGPAGFGRAARAAAGAFALSTALAGCKEESKPEPAKPDPLASAPSASASPSWKPTATGVAAPPASTKKQPPNSHKLYGAPPADGLLV